MTHAQEALLEEIGRFLALWAHRHGYSQSEELLTKRLRALVQDRERRWARQGQLAFDVAKIEPPRHRLETFVTLFRDATGCTELDARDFYHAHYARHHGGAHE